jgi:hypothetical protein
MNQALPDGGAVKRWSILSDAKIAWAKGDVSPHNVKAGVGI